MSYVIPAGFSRLSFQYAPVSPIGSAVAWGLGVESPPSAAILNEIVLWYEDEFAPQQNEAYVLQRAEMRSDTLVEEIITSIPGTETIAFPPPQVAALVSLSTGLPGRTNRGRVYWPGLVSEPDINVQGQIDNTRRSQVSTLFGGLQEILEGLSAPLVILHSGSSDPTPVTSFTVRENVATQRRRQRA